MPPLDELVEPLPQHPEVVDLSTAYLRGFRDGMDTVICHMDYWVKWHYSYTLTSRRLRLITAQRGDPFFGNNWLWKNRIDRTPEEPMPNHLVMPPPHPRKRRRTPSPRNWLSPLQSLEPGVTHSLYYSSD